MIQKLLKILKKIMRRLLLSEIEPLSYEIDNSKQKDLSSFQ